MFWGYPGMPKVGSDMNAVWNRYESIRILFKEYYHRHGYEARPF